MARTCYQYLSWGIRRDRAPPSPSTLALELRRGDLSLVELTRVAAEELARDVGADRVGVWRYSESGTELRNMTVYIAAHGVHEVESPIPSASAPIYLNALSAGRILEVGDVATDPRTVELLDAYLRPLGIVTLLAAPVFVGGNSVGMVCVGATRPRAWTADEQAIVATVADLVALAFVQLELAESRALYRSVVEDQTDFVLRTKPSGLIFFSNRAVNEGAGRSIMGENVLDFVRPEDKRIVVEARKRLTPAEPLTTYEHPVLALGAARIVQWTLRGLFDDEGKLREMQAIGRDVTETREREARLREAERLQSLAVFSSGVAHDFNNLLTPIVGFAAILEGELEDAQKSMATDIVTAGRKAAQLVRQILVFSRAGRAEAVVVDVAKDLREAATFLRASVPATIAIVNAVDADCGAILAEPSDLFQIVSNLGTNAWHAMASGGTLTVAAYRVVVDGRPWVELTVADTGAGMTEEVRARIFDPFFTTRSHASGTGLGLSVVHGTVTRLQGTIDVVSSPDSGTRFVIRLPLVTQKPVTPSSPAPPTKHRACRGRILVVDDESAVLAVIRAALQRADFVVTVSSSASEAIEKLSADVTAFDLVVTDLTMPTMSGVELAWRCRALRPELPIVVLSGFSASLHEARACPSVVLVLAKPFEPGDLVGKIESLLP